MDATEIGLRLIGAFYAFAGYVATRAGLTSLLLDRAIAAIAAEKPNAAEMARTAWLLAASNLILAGGALLMVLADLAAWLFAASAVAQAAYLFVVSPRFFDPGDPPDPTGRQQSTNAFVLYSAATAFVLWAAYTGKLVAWQDMRWEVLAIVAALVAAHVAYTGWMAATTLRSSKPPRIGGAALGAGASSSGQRSLSKRIKVMADYDSHPLWALDGQYGDLAPEELGLSPELARDLNAWGAAYSSSFDRADPATSLWTEEQQLAHEAEGRPLAARLARERPDRMVYVLDRTVGVVEVRCDERE